MVIYHFTYFNADPASMNHFLSFSVIKIDLELCAMALYALWVLSIVAIVKQLSVGQIY